VAYLTRRVDYVNVIGNIWQPGAGVCAYSYTLSPRDLSKACRHMTTGNRGR